MAGAQSEFKFQTSNSSPGYESWREERRRQRAELAESFGLPIGKPVEVWLRGGIRLRGELHLREDLLVHAVCSLENTQFEVNGVTFHYNEMESCLRSADTPVRNG
jgi:hypothetical protein